MQGENKENNKGVVVTSEVCLAPFSQSKFQEKGFVLWFTGFSGAGKTTVADAVFEFLKTKRNNCLERLDGDIVREHLTKNLSFSKEDRFENIRRITFVAELLSRNNVAVVSAFISPYREMRQILRDNVTNFIEVFVNAPIEVCEQRDVKGLYKRAREGYIPNFTGISAPYEPPENPEIELRTDLETVEESVTKVINYLEENFFI